MARSARPLDVYPITIRPLEVLRVADVTPGMRRVTLGGPGLAAHVAPNGLPVNAFRSDGFDDEGKLFLHHPDAAAPVVPTQADGVLDWPRHEHLLMRTYTVRRWDREAGEVDLDFVRHGVGPATTWAATVAPGAQVWWAGPKSSAGHPVGVDWTLVAGDETALPAIGRWLEHWPAGARGQVFVEIAEASHRQDLPVPAGVELTWLSRDGAEPGTTSLLLDALRAAPWWDGAVYAWVSGEALTLAPIRRWLRNEKSLPKENVEVTGYWRRQEVVVTDDSGVQDLDASTDVGMAFHELAELAPAVALRVAATLGLAGALGDGSASLDDLAAATGADPVGLGKLVRYLATLDVVTRADDGRIALTGVGRRLEDDHIAESLDLGGLAAQRELAGLLGLLEALHPGRGALASDWAGQWRERSARDADLLDARLDREAGDATYTAGALASSPAVAGLATIAVLGRGAGTYAEALVAAHPDVRVSVVAAPSELDALGRLHPRHERIALVAGSPLHRREEPVDAVLLADALAGLPDADARHALAEAAASITPSGRVLVFGDALNPDLADEHDYEDDLIEFALTGGGARTDAEHRALFAAAGMADPQRSTIGWGYTLYSWTPRAGS